MARAIWTGAISFGLVNVPVKLYAATSPKSVRFHQLSSKTGGRIRQKRVDSTTGDEVPFEDIVKGYEITPDRYVVITPEELETLDAKATKTIDVEDFVDLVDIDPIYFDHAYYVAPATGGAKAYRLLLDAMRESGKVALARIVLRSKQQLAALRPAGDVLTLSTMLFGDEVLTPDRLDELDSVSEAEASERELKMARQLIDSLSSDFEPAKYRDEYRERVLALIERKAGGEEIAVQPTAEEPDAAPDLMAALEASLAAVKDERPAPAPASKPRKRAAGAKDGGEGAKPKRRAAATK
ncbi:MAG TPA: Ku protein [Solirubrobacteraceae bacterium]|jgi:DNA end-binding protein Ku|nr:Ku protein [Solirubrobacteraceae bacterium]